MADSKKIQNANTKRIISVDVLRGITIFLMFFVDTLCGPRFECFTHPIWEGLTLADFIFPTFITLVGVSLAFSLSKYNYKASKSSLFRIFRRFALLLVFGWIVINVGNAIPRAFAGKDFFQVLFDFSNFRIMGVFTRIALSYLFGALIVLFVHNKKVIVGIIASILIGYAFLLFFGHGYDMDANTNIIAIVDNNVLGTDHVYKMGIDSNTEIPFDPEGIVSTIPCIAQTLLGFLIGRIILDKKKNLSNKIIYMFVIGFSLLVVGFLTSTFIPCFKKVWSTSFVLITVGTDACMLALFTWIIEAKGYKKWTGFFRILGSNAFISFAAMDIFFPILTGLKITTSIYTFMLPIFGGITGFATMFVSLLFIIVWWFVLYALDKKKIYIRL